MPEPLYLEDVSHLKCGNPHCNHSACDGYLWLHQRCHMKQGVDLSLRGDGSGVSIILVVRCSVCQEIVAEFQLAKKISEYQRVWLLHHEGIIYVKKFQTEETLESVELASKNG